MPSYRYEAIDAEGITQEGNMEGSNPDALADSLQKKGWIVLNIAEGGARSAPKPESGSMSSHIPASSPAARKSRSSSSQELSGFAKLNQRFNERFGAVSTAGSVKLATLLLFTNQLSSMVGAGLHLLKSLNSLSEDTSDKRFQAILEQVRTDVEGGEAFSSALAKYPKVFSNIYVNLVKAAEATGDMDVILNQLAVYLDKTLTLRRKVKGAMTYPVVILSFAMIAIIVIIVKIVPSFQKTFAKLGADLPAPTRILIATSDIIRNYFVLVVLISGGIVFLLWRLCQTERGRFMWDSFIIRVPIFGPLIWKTILTRFLRTLSILLDSGVTVLDAFQLAGQTAGNKVVEKAARQCVEDIRDGRTIHESLADRKLFPDMVVRMVASGEEAGTLPEMLRKTTIYFEQQVETAVDSLSSLIEPVLILILGVVVGSIIIAIFLPIFKLGDAVKKGMR